MSVKASGKIAEFDGSGDGYSDWVSLNPGRHTMNLKTDGMTVAIQCKHRDQDQSHFKTVGLPLNDGTTAASTTTDLFVAVGGGCDYRAYVSAGTGSGYIKFDALES